MKSEMLTSLECRFNYIEQIEELCVATILDPRFKHHFFMGTETHQLTRQYLIDNCGYITGVDEPPTKGYGMIIYTTTSGGNDQASSSKIWECFTKLLEEAGATSDLGGGVESMVDNYLSEPLIDYKQSDPLKWWHDNERRYPFLGNMAKQFLSAPPTSVPSEQLFSGVGNLYNEKRSKLNPEHAEMLLHIKYNKHLVQALRFDLRIYTLYIKVLKYISVSESQSVIL